MLCEEKGYSRGLLGGCMLIVKAFAGSECSHHSHFLRRWKSSHLICMGQVIEFGAVFSTHILHSHSAVSDHRVLLKL